VSLAQRLRDYGLYPRGGTRLDPQELEDYGFAAERPSILLVGNIGSSYWPVFSESAEYLDGAAHPLDRWSRRVAEVIAAEFSLTPVYPFEGPPYYPFQRWAQRAESLEQSPIGVMMHPEYGLWHSYRFALLGAEFESDQAPPVAASPCLDCSEKPCLQRCPVGAFDESGYDVERCASYLQQTPLAECHALGCLARYACPVAPELRYIPAQGRFHLQAFLDARR
jgi:hypothetical protein